MTLGYYILDHNREPIPCDRDAYYAYRQSLGIIRVDRTAVTDVIEVSTIFLGMDHNYTGEGPPLLFESMTFRNGSNGVGEECERYATWDEAEKGHAAMVDRVA